MSTSLEIAGSCFTLAGALWLSIDAFCIRRHIRAEAGASKLLELLEKVHAGEALKDKKGKPLNSKEALQMWFAGRTITWNCIALGLVTIGFALDLIGKLKS